MNYTSTKATKILQLTPDDILDIGTKYINGNFHTANTSNTLDIKHLRNLIGNLPNNTLSPDNKATLGEYNYERLSSHLNRYFANNNNNIKEILTKLPGKMKFIRP